MYYIGFDIGGTKYASVLAQADDGHIRLEKSGPAGYGKAGSFEGFCSGGSIAQLSGGRTARDVAAAADKGDPKAKKILAKAGRYFGRGLAVLIDILNPEIIVAGSIFARAGRHLTKTMYAELKKEALPRSLSACRVVPAALGEKIGDYGAIVTAMS